MLKWLLPERIEMDRRHVTQHMGWILKIDKRRHIGWSVSSFRCPPIVYNKKFGKLTVRVCANGVCAVRTCCWIAAVYSDMPLWNAPSTCSNIVLHDCSNAGITDDSKLERNVSCRNEIKRTQLLSTISLKNKTLTPQPTATRFSSWWCSAIRSVP